MKNAIDTSSQAVLFQRLRWTVFRNNARLHWQGSPVRLLTMLVASVLVWVGVFAVSAVGFYYLQLDQIPFAGGIIGTLFDLMFLSLAAMLVFSSGIMLYSSLFSAPESAFLLSTPAAADQVFAYRFQGAVGFSSLAFILLGSPVLIAYGVMHGVPWFYYALLPLFVLGFVLVPGSVGALACLLIVNLMPRRPKQVVAAALVLLLAATLLWGYRMSRSLHEQEWDRDLLQDLVGQIRFVQGPLIPSHWMTRGLQAAARGELAEASYRLALVWANGLFLYVVVAGCAARLYRAGYNRVATGGSLRRRPGGAWLDRAVSSTMFFLNPQTRLLLVKDFRTFRRDPAQWAQVLIFTGLLTLYLANMRGFFEADMGKTYLNGINLLNLVSTGLLMCAYTSRFIYPLLSLEGRKFWILGLLPLQRDRLLWGKFVFAATGALLIAEFLVLFGDFTMQIPLAAMALHALTVAVLAAGLSGLSVGLGAWVPNFRESDPSKIAVGLGGTLNLIASLLFTMLVVGLMAAPWHIEIALSGDRDWTEIRWGASVWFGIAAGLATGLTATLVPLRIGSKALREMEF